MKQRTLILAFVALAVGVWNGNTSIQAASRYHLIIVHSSNNTGEGTITVDRADLHPVPMVGDIERECSSAVCGATYGVGTRVTLTATPAPGSTFTGWGGDCSGTAPTCVVRMAGHRDVLAYFSR